ncbi:aminotransferase class V-fold PLP-dependent enzyme [Tropicimonas sp. TH_r6]|uniref:aminotransferase class V-fold PLP-dependent enzyme n=1 Tax=Tropicimonas sp. TH_r6 TaxID=3082085 RepID=UPI002953101B|nr:aminotransferase class V-fold PLP-dependent enzyme [Tropicimonas sp. TH_r6]MDV7145380.1 aminotransferase class V-fold PLP-dependent enzyme [Tropicimonas sp. TH_r6]
MTDTPLQQDPMLLPDMRSEFDLPREIVWMNCAQMSPMHASVVAAGQASVMRKARPWEAVPASFLPELEQTRAAFAALLNATSDSIAILPACSYGIATAARNIPLGPNRNVVIVEEQFPSNRLIWERRCAESGATLKTARRTGAGDITGPMLEAIDRATAVVACGAVHWTDGTPIDLVAVSARAREVGAALVLDLTQSLGAIPFDAQAIDPDYAVAPSYKWLLGPYSLGGLYVAPRNWDGTPLEESHMDRSDRLAAMAGATPPYDAGARRFDVGEKVNFQLMPMLLASLSLLGQLGPDRIAETLRRKTNWLADALAERGFELPPNHLRSPHFFGTLPPERAPDDLGARLEAEGVYLSTRNGKLRLAPHLWNDAEDLDRFLSALDSCMAR